jgi:hypothetical protein
MAGKIGREEAFLATVGLDWNVGGNTQNWWAVGKLALLADSRKRQQHAVDNAARTPLIAVTHFKWGSFA